MYRLAALLSRLGAIQERGVRDASRDAVSVVRRPIVVQNLPGHLQIEIITRCNLGCVTCPRTVALEQANSREQREPWLRRMSIEQFREIISQLPNLQAVSLHGIGEPLMHRQIFEMVEVAANRGIKVRFTTNATLLTRAICERLIQSGLHRLIISMDGATSETFEAIRVGARFDRVVENARTLIALRGERVSSTPIIDVNVVVSQLNYSEVLQLLDLSDDLGVDCVILSPLVPSGPDLAELVCNPENWTDITREAIRRARKLGIKLHIRGGDRSFVPVDGMNEKKTYQCLHPWLSAVVTLDGDVMPCCNIHSPASRMGNVFDSSLTDVWNGLKYKSFRAELRQKGHAPEPCQQCPDF